MTSPPNSPRRRARATVRGVLADAPTWMRALTAQVTAGRDVVLVVAGEPQQHQIADLARATGHEIAVASDAHAASEVLARRGNQIGVAIVASQPGWGPELRALLAADYPAIQRITLIG